MAGDLELRIAPEVVERHPDVVVRAVQASDLVAASGRVVGPSSEAIRRQLESEGVAAGTLSRHPAIAAWREAIGRCGLKPSRYRSSAEALARRWLSGEGVVSAVALVQLYCRVSALHLAPLGAFDLDRLPGEAVELRLGRPSTDRFVPLGGDGGSMVITGRVVVYGSGSTVLTYAFNHRDSAETCLTTTTTRAVFLGEATTAEQDRRLRAALADLRQYLEQAGAVVGDDIVAPHLSAGGSSPTRAAASRAK